MSRTVITSDDLGVEPEGPDAGSGAALRETPAGSAGRRAGLATLIGVAAITLLLGVGGGFAIGQSTRPSATEADAELRAAIREVRDDMRAARQRSVASAVAKERSAGRARQRQALRALRAKLTDAPAPRRAVVSSPARSSTPNVASGPVGGPVSTSAPPVPRPTSPSKGMSCAQDGIGIACE